MANMTTPNETTGQQRNENQSGARSESNQAPRTDTAQGAQTAVGRASSGAASLATKGVQQTRERFDSQIAEQREQISKRVRAVGRALHGAGEMLEEDGLASRGLHYASEKVEDVASYVADLSPDRVAADLRSVAASRPLWFYGGAFTLGLALGRFARSTGAGVSSASAGAIESAKGARASTSAGETERGARSANTPARTNTPERRP